MDRSLSQELIGFSKALYSTWFLYQPSHLLFDAGEGVATILEQKVTAVDYLFLSHGHLDHISGLPTFISIRDRVLGPHARPLSIYYPRGDLFVEGMRDYLMAANPRMGYPLEWIPLVAGEVISITDGERKQHGREVLAFATEHRPDGLTLGYHLMEKRHQLKPEFASLPGSEIQKLGQEGRRKEMTQEYRHCLLTYVGDTVPLPLEQYEQTDLLLHEATHIGKGVGHSRIAETIELAGKLNPKQLVIYHLSPRYPWEKVLEEVRAECQKHKLTFPVWVQWLDQLKSIDY